MFLKSGPSLKKIIFTSGLFSLAKLTTWLLTNEIQVTKQMKEYGHYWNEIDYLEDYKVIKLIYENLYEKNKNFSAIDILCHLCRMYSFY